MIRIETFSGGPFAENGYLAVCEATGAAVAVDPGAGAAGMLASLRSESLEPTAILLTHAHLDHVEGVPALRAEFPSVPIFLHEADLPLYRAAPEQASAFGLSIDELPEPDHGWGDGDRFEFGARDWEVRHAPGHSPGHVVLVDQEAGVALVGDVIFQNSIGRTDLPGGDFKSLMTSIREQILTLPDEMRLLSGHGPETTVGYERSHNPFLIPHYGGRLA